MLLKVDLTPRKAYPEVKLQGRDLVRVVGNVAPFTPLGAGRDRVEIVEGSCGYRARGVSIRGKFVLSRNMEYKTRWVAMLINVVLTPGKPIPKSNFRDGNWYELWVLLPSLSHWGPEPGENSFYRTREGKLAQETCAGCH